jgi:predicted metal-dependent phosphoesterase TrpH
LSSLALLRNDLMRVDLHMHSTASDGAYSPEEVVQIALSKAMDVIALTDHDSIGGITRAQAATAGTSLEILAGIELSAEDEDADRHILGYMFDPGSAALSTLLMQLRQARVDRIRRMVDKLAALDVVVPVEEVLALADGGSVGRVHMARILLRRGYVVSLQDAFDRYISNDGPAYVPHYPLTPQQAIDTVHQSGGVAVLAHPGRYADYRTIIAELVPLGLDGIEVYYPDHTPPIIAELRALARQYGLLMTIGSDFHRRDGDGSTSIGTIKSPADLDVVGSLRERAAHRA